MNPLMLNPIPEENKSGISYLVRQMSKTNGTLDLLDYLDQERLALDSRLRSERDEVTLRRLQGAAQALEDILCELERVSAVHRPWKAH
jgi:hypothetical protein